MQQLKVLRDRVAIRRMEYKNQYIAVVGVVLQKGEVVAIGPGRRERRKTKFCGMPGHPPIWFEDGAETGIVTPMKVKVGDYVEFSPREQFEFPFNGEKLVMVWQNSIYYISDDSPSNALLFQKSAGFDRQGNFLSGKEEFIG
jgi:co-chaperonin GroES (HSP10)